MKRTNGTRSWETAAVKGLVDRDIHEKIVQAIQKMKSGKATIPKEVSVKMIIASGKNEVEVMMDLWQLMLNH